MADTVTCPRCGAWGVNPDRVLYTGRVICANCGLVFHDDGDDDG